MKNARRLSLKAEALTELSTDDLAGVAGGYWDPTPKCPVTNGYGLCSFLCQMTFNTCG